MLLTWRTRWWLLLGTALCLFLANALNRPLTAERHRKRLVMRADTSGMPPEYILTSAVLGGFRSLAVQVLWRRAQKMKQDGDYYEMVDLYNIITKLQPGQHQAWAFQAWDLAYNVSVEFHNLEDRVFWLFRGIDLLRQQGIPKNDQVPELASECSWIIQHKLGRTLDYAHPYYRQYLAAQMQGILRTAGDAEEQRELIAAIARLPRAPVDFERLEGFTDARARLAAAGLDVWSDDWSALSAGPQGRPDARALVEREPGVRNALVAVQLWTIGQQLRDRVGMDPVRMNAMSERYGALDWRVAFTHSLYWAQIAYDIWWRKPNKKTQDLKFERFVYFSLIDLTRAGRAVWGQDGFVHYLPDFDKVEAVVKHMESMFRRFHNWTDSTGVRANLTGSYSGFHYFLRDSIFRAYFEGRKDQAAALLRRAIINEWQRNLEWDAERLRLTPTQIKIVEEGNYDEIVQFMPIPNDYAGTLDDFFARLFNEYMDSPTVDRAQAFLESYLLSGYRALALDNLDRYEMMRDMTEAFYKDYVLVRWPQKPPDYGDDLDNRHFIAPMIDLRVRALMRLLTDQLENAPLAFDQQTGGGTGPTVSEGGVISLSPHLKQLLVMRLAEMEPNTYAALMREIERQQTQQAARLEAQRGPVAAP